jgi:hypothetical protein
LTFILQLSFFELEFNLSLVDVEFMLQLLLFAAPLLHFLLFNKHYVGKCLINDLRAASSSSGEVIIIVSNGTHLALDLDWETVAVNVNCLLTNGIDENGAVGARTKEEP